MNKKEQPDVKRDLKTSRGDLHFTVYKLLNEVEKHPVIWDKKNPDYKNMDVKLPAWNNVTRIFVPFFDELDEDERSELTNILMRRYRTCLNHLMTSITLKRKGDPKYRPYCYLRPLKFYVEMRGWKVEDFYDEQELIGIEEDEQINVKWEIDPDQEENDDEQLDEIEIQLRKELGVDVEEDKVNDNAVSSSKKDKPNDTLTPTYRSARLRGRQTMLDASKKEEKITPKNKRLSARFTEIKKSPITPNTSAAANALLYCETTTNSEVEDDAKDYGADNMEQDHEIEQQDHEMEEQLQFNHSQQQLQQSTPRKASIKSNGVVVSSPTNINSNGYSYDPEDVDQAFFESIKPLIQKMNETQKLDFKIDVLQALRSFQT